MKRVIVSGRTVEDAVTSALVRLGIPRAQASVRVLAEPVKGLFGLIGGREAQVEVTAVQSPPEQAKDFLNGVLQRMGVDAVSHIRTQSVPEAACELEIYCEEPDVSLIIGRHGVTLDALQYLVSIVANQDQERYVRFTVDAAAYRNRRKQGLERVADLAAARALRTRRPVNLEPMSAADRKLIHTHLEDRTDVSTASEGVEPHRKVVVTPVLIGQTASSGARRQAARSGRDRNG